MNKVKKIFLGAATAAMVLGNMVIPAAAVAPWNVTGDYEITFFLDGDVSNTPYIHHAELAQTGSTVTGDGGYPATGGDTYHWNVTTGSQTGNSLNLTVDYDLGAIGTTMNMTGTIAPDGTVTGTWSDNFGGSRTGTWSITKGVSTPMIHTPANGASVTQSALVKVDWTDSIGANPPFEYKYEAYSDAEYTSLVYASPWLSNSEILTPGTPPGDYYLRVKARNASLDESAWSNDDVNPFHITVTADPTPTPTGPEIPEQCAQNVTYNVIEGTGANEILNGTNGPDLILAKGGSDVVNGGNGNDCIVGGVGSDVLKGGNGADIILGGADSDSISGDNGNDQLYGQNGSDDINGGLGDDILEGGADSDSLKGGNGNDTLIGGAGSDSANGNSGNDICNAEAESSCEL